MSGLIVFTVKAAVLITNVTIISGKIVCCLNPHNKMLFCDSVSRFTNMDDAHS